PPKNAQVKIGARAHIEPDAGKKVLFEPPAGERAHCEPSEKDIRNRL
ncbi:hypothetical protein HMPREF9069_01528, partial [Atopobium sp. oral taxon 810 str. F0209]